MHLSDADLYKILLANPALSTDELLMYTEKIANEFKKCCFDLFLWTGEILGNRIGDSSSTNDALNYFKRAVTEKPTEIQPYLSILGLYNYEIDLPINSEIIKEVVSGIKKAKQTSKLYYALADHYEKAENYHLKKKYLGLAEKAALQENQ